VVQEGLWGDVGEGAALPSIGVFQNPATVCERHAGQFALCGGLSVAG
jgi:hypothetical protein